MGVNKSTPASTSWELERAGARRFSGPFRISARGIDPARSSWFLETPPTEELMPEKATYKPFDSHHTTGRERYLAQVMEYALAESWASAEDFLRHFPPRKIITTLKEQDDLRVEILVKAGKVHQKLAAKKSIESAAEDLELAVSEGICEPREVLEVFKPDDRITHLDAAELWKFANEGEFYSVGAIDTDYDRVLARIVFMIEQALDQRLITLEDIGDALTFEEIASLMPIERLQDVVRHALKEGRTGNPLTEEALLSIVPLPELLGFFDLEQVWKRVILTKIAGPQNYIGANDVPKEDKSDSGKKDAKPAGKATTKTSAKTPAKSAGKSTSAAKSPPKATSASKPPPPPPDYDDNVPSDTVEVGNEDLSPELESDDPQVQAMARLKEIDRLPPSAATLPLPVLLSIESMYAELEYAETDEEREELIRESFPNEALMRQAMLALIELLDPSIDTKDALIKDAEIDSLIKIVMFEERRRR